MMVRSENEIDGAIVIIFEFKIRFLFSEIMMCPAIILAVRRRVRVSGRMRNLIVSIMNMNGISRFGVPWGIKWIRKCFFFLDIKIVRMGIHIINTIVRFIDR